ncbi:hypothetical protein A3742_29200 [Oleiphilus sp. HI0071]|uniref:YraN family protein n=1 Tax=unclassified Oleiphilus TaxID=2631174 RepID=UPI0007C36E1C|nr:MULTISPECIES: YraN family protein [unclassified Oleiphilus]KZY60241.1 hypothetical protein A3737_07465 [Oleiphilus sp. HI0065]KZY82553.1 hypothetical protein A3742_09380 [Oleiphilus sp. HI0071]KZY90934.1 hypothetical protein A3744_15335 [Oleiphilus sp. HI0073]KZZ41759.1 hypothetical protein A3758_22325 [Oleiphilus sp. HI0118]KZZ50708.1 hypothetical protein A3760_13895 [Oleiphilus sp. HI0122]KZZ77278.1 hypothetical protein A3765_09065 [Oleiphilus sp. HI0130]KZZ78794.1 hypothetical protein 
MRSKGFEFENKAKHYLQSKGLKLVLQNYSCRLGEIDLIMLDRSTIVFVEVRYRNTAKYGSALESITSNKRSKLLKAANHYLTSRADTSRPCRFDVIAFDNKNNETEVSWIVSAFGEPSYR